MDKLSYDINMIVMDTIGLAIGPDGMMYDTDTGAVLVVDNRPVTAPNVKGKGTVEFDPFNNTKMMSQLFSYYTKRYEEDTGLGVDIFYTVPVGNMSYFACTMADRRTYNSAAYIRDSLKYIDLMLQLTNGDAVSAGYIKDFLTPYNVPKVDYNELKKQATKKKPKKASK